MLYFLVLFFFPFSFFFFLFLPCTGSAHVCLLYLSIIIFLEDGRRVSYAATEAIQRLGYSTIKPEQLQVVSSIVSGCFRCFADRLRQEPVLCVLADSVWPGVAGREDIDSLCSRSFDGYYERSGKCRKPPRVLAAVSEA